MHIKRVHAERFRRFTDLTVELSGTPQLVVLAGPNGTGKSSLFDALKVWHDIHGGGAPFGVVGDVEYLSKGDVGIPFNHAERAQVEFHEDESTLTDPRERIYVRSAYRNEAEFELNQIQRAGSLYDAPRPLRIIDNDVRVSDNYQRLVGQTLESLYGGEGDTVTGRELRERFIGEVRDAFQTIFPDLVLEGPGDPLAGGTFRFRKDAISGFHYKNLSGGEKGVFDLLLDLMVKRASYANTVFCIDEPDVHTNTRVQGLILDGLLRFINAESQLWIATHSIGMMRRARELQNEDPNRVVFLDFEDQDFDDAVVLRPVSVDRDFWRRTLKVALGDLAALVAPAQVVLCEGRPTGGDRGRPEFDARCYRAIFGDQMPDTDFMSVGNEREVRNDELKVGRSIQTIVDGTKVIQLVDRDLRSAQEVEELENEGTRVLGRRHLESYLLDDEVLTALCESVGKGDLVQQVLDAKQQKHDDSVNNRGKDPDDWKSPSGPIAVECRRILGLTGAGSGARFLSDTLAPLVKPGMAVYEELNSDIFG